MFLLQLRRLQRFLQTNSAERSLLWLSRREDMHYWQKTEKPMPVLSVSKMLGNGYEEGSRPGGTPENQGTRPKWGRKHQQFTLGHASWTNSRCREQSRVQGGESRELRGSYLKWFFFNLLFPMNVEIFYYRILFLTFALQQTNSFINWWNGLSIYRTSPRYQSRIKYDYWGQDGTSCWLRLSRIGPLTSRTESSWRVALPSIETRRNSPA